MCATRNSYTKLFKHYDFSSGFCDRYGTSNTAGAAVANSILQDYSLLNDQNTADRKKLWRARETRRKELKNISTKQPKSLYFDGRKDKTLQNTGILSTEEDITISFLLTQHL